MKNNTEAKNIQSRDDVQRMIATTRMKGLKRGIRKPLSPEAMRTASLEWNAALRTWGNLQGFGKQPATFPEVSRFKGVSKKLRLMKLRGLM